MPRPFSLLGNSLMFGGGVVVALLEGYRGAESRLPAWLFLLLWFLIQEGLVQQAKYMWNDVRDHARDQANPANSKRPIARAPRSRSTIPLMLLRWGGGLLLATLLSPDLLAVALLISGLQVVYELWAKPRAARYPVAPLFIVGAGAMLKGAGGCLALGAAAGDQRLWFYGAAMLATGVVFVSSFWRVEAGYFGARGLAQPRGQNVYFAQHGLAWLKAGTGSMVAACTILILDGVVHFLGHAALPTGMILMIIAVMGMAGCGLVYGLVIGPAVLRMTAGVLFFGGCAAVLWGSGASLFPLSRETLAAALVLLGLLADHWLNWRMDYEQQNLLYFDENWRDWRRLARERGMGQWRMLAILLPVLNSPRYRLLRERREEVRRTRTGSPTV